MKKLTVLILPAIAGIAFLLSSCGGKSGSGGAATDSTAMMTAKNKQTAANAILSASKHDIDAMFKDCSPDYLDYGVGVGDGKTMKLDSSKAGFKEFLSSFPDLHADNIVVLAQGDTAAVMATWTGTFKVAMGKMQPTGKAFKVFDEDIFTFNKDGKITSHKSIVPNSVYLEQVGAAMK